MKTALIRAMVVLIASALAFPSVAQMPPQQGQPPAAPPAGGAPAYKQEELEQMLAPIALYPDALVTQVLMASTYPLEIVEASRWIEQNKGLTGTALQDALQKQPWDASVKSLTAFPQVLDRLNKDISWTQKLGDAFLGQQKQVLDTIQSLRKKSQDAGYLKSNPQQTVQTQTQEGKEVIVIEPANPQTVYVPTYEPAVVYGTWPYPAYPPYYPPYWGAPFGGAFVGGFAWGVGLAAGAALWSSCNWAHGDVNVNTNRYNNFNRSNLSNSNWQHNPEHRGGAPYRDSASQQKFGQGNRQAAQARNDFRGHEGGGGGLDRSGGAGGGGFGGDRGSGAGGAFGGGSGAQTRDSSSRGNSSMGGRSYGGGGGFGGGGGRGGGRGGRR